MLYYEFTVTTDTAIECRPENDRRIDIDFPESINSAVSMANDRMPYNVHFYVCNIKDRTITLAGVIGSRNKVEPSTLVSSFVQQLGYSVEGVEGEEITCAGYARLIRQGERKDFLDDTDEILLKSALDTYKDCISNRCEELLAEADSTEEKLYEESLSLPCCSSMQAELDRIFASERRDFMGHPVHYMIFADDISQKSTIELLVTALYSAGRLKSRRVSCIKTRIVEELFSNSKKKILDMELINNVYRAIPGGTMAIRPGMLEYEMDTIDSDTATIEDLASCIDSHKQDCLTILLFSKEERKIAERLKARLGKMRFVEIAEEACSADKARSILGLKAKEDNIPQYSSLLSSVQEDEAGYYMSDIERIYREWKETHICADFYPLYENIKMGGVKEKKPIGNAYEELQQLIGLGKVKSMVKQAVDFNRFQKLYSDRGLSDMRPSRHMVFTGNPGTAKTTVARLFAQIMKNNKVLPVGKLVEVGRKDLVGKYVGWTARLVQEAFERARGSVLFIDEAYSLCDGRSGNYGDEAINTIVQMMENQRDDTIVIFAGYPDRMQEFLGRNPGLRSRIAFHMDFADYTEDELVQILHLIAKQNSVTLSLGVEQKVRDIIGRAIDMKDFGNGRFVRNLFERARMAQASRVMEMEESEIDNEVLTTLIAQDFTMPDELEVKTNRRPIGFAV